MITFAKKTLSLSLGLALALTAAATAGGPGQTAGPISFYGPNSYTGIGDSPVFNLGCDRPGVEFYFENFEDGALNTPGVVVQGPAFGAPGANAEIFGPSAAADSVDPSGRSLRATTASAGMITLAFDDLPENVSFAITDTNGASGVTFTFTVFDGNGNIGNFIVAGVGDGSAASTTDDDVGFAVNSPNGIDTISISSSGGPLWEMDHLAYTRHAASYGLPSRGDMDGSGSGDLLTHIASGAVTAWYLNDLTETKTIITSALGGGWTVQGFGDLDGDCDDDIIWRNNTNPSKVQVWLMQDGQVVQKTNITTTLSTAWQITAINDFDGDGRADLFMEWDAGKKMRIWFMNGSSIIGSSYVTSSGFDPSLYTVCTSGDINGDSNADIVWRKTSNGDLRYFRMNGATVTTNGLIQAGLSTAWTAMGGGDLDGDGVLDLAFRNSTSTGVLLAKLNSNFTVNSSAQLTLAAGFTFVGFPDVNGDGKADLVWRKTSNGILVRWKMNGLQVVSSATIGTGPTGTAKVYAEK